MDVTVVGVQLNDNINQQVDPTHKAARVAIRPVETTVYGSYRKALKSGVIAAGLSGPLPIWEMRWGQSSVIAIVRKLKFQAVVSATAFNATAADSSFSLYRAQGFSAMDGTNGTFAAFTKNKASATATRMNNTQLAGDTSANRINQGGIVILNTSASGLTGGTKILDDDPFHLVLGKIAASAAAETTITPDPFVNLIDPAEAGRNPTELSMNEGLVLQCDSITATGTWRFVVEVEWDEVDPQRYF
jgi:hypothetical protein